MVTTKITHVAHLVEICVQYGMQEVVVSPGSRNAPLVIAFDAHPKINVKVVHDERSAAFFALGLAEATQKPVAITCTSGSAPLNYAPAIVEAYYRNIPLVVLTADRPVALIDQGDGQTIRQKNVYNNYIKSQFELPDFPNAKMRVKSDQIVSTALESACTTPQGPVHINIPLAEPLYETQELNDNLWIEKNAEPLTKQLAPDEIEFIQQTWNTTAKKLVIIGQIAPNEWPVEVLKPLINDPSVAFLVENVSNVRHFERFCHCIDRTLATISADEINEFKPDLLISMGGAIVSKKIKAFFRKNKPKYHWRVGEYLIESDTYFSLTSGFNVSVKAFMKAFDGMDIVPLSNFGSKWKQKDFLAEEVHQRYLTEIAFSDFQAFDIILDSMPQPANLHMSNSSVVRYCQLFDPVRDIQYFANRGVSGIDGSTSTAVGIATANQSKLNVIITGDTSFFYDSNAFWNAYLPANLRIIVINNGGGGIFKIIDGPAKSAQADLFYAPFSADISAICKAFNIHYQYANAANDLLNSMSEFYTHSSDNRPKLLEVDTRNIENQLVLKKYFSELAHI